MQIIKKEHDRQSYLEYTDLDSKITFDNGHYFIIDMTDKELQEDVAHTGGFCANIMRREISDKNLQNVTKILFYGVPQKTIDSLFGIIYMDDDYNVKHYLYDDNFNDYLYFQKRFSKYIRTGFISELKTIDNLAEFTAEFENPSVDFGFMVDNQPATVDHEYTASDYTEMVIDDAAKRFKELNVSHIRLTPQIDVISGLHLKCVPYTTDGVAIKEYQFKGKYKSEDDYAAFLRRRYEGITDYQVQWRIDAVLSFEMTTESLRVLVNKKNVRLAFADKQCN
jgi:hypothetical protein